METTNFAQACQNATAAQLTRYREVCEKVLEGETESMRLRFMASDFIAAIEAEETYRRNTPALLMSKVRNS